jgi:hypothetical protein
VVAGRDLERLSLREALSQKVEPLLMPRRLCLLPRLPRDARGKLGKGAVERWVQLPGYDLLDLELEPLAVTLRLRPDSRRLDGHFPGAPVLPAVAQLLDLVVPEVERLAGRPITSARRLKWQEPVLPGSVVVLTIEMTAPSRYRFRLRGAGDVVLSSGTLETAPEAAS